MDSRLARLFKRPTLEVAPRLLGRVIARLMKDGRVLRCTFAEVEAYHESEPGSHAYHGVTRRNAAMFGPPGHAYVYFVYGMYYCLNITTEREAEGAAILVRGLLPPEDERELRLTGPGLICKNLDIDRARHNGLDLLDDGNGQLWLEWGRGAPAKDVIAAPRVGLSERQAPDLPWRFSLRGWKHGKGLADDGAAASRRRFRGL
jgi:DNA-3-methyladenine glycosylase